METLTAVPALSSSCFPHARAATWDLELKVLQQCGTDDFVFAGLWQALWLRYNREILPSQTSESGAANEKPTEHTSNPQEGRRIWLFGIFYLLVYFQKRFQQRFQNAD